MMKNNRSKNTLYPVFLKVRALNILIVGGGCVALEKLTFLFKSSPDAKVQMVAPMFRSETLSLARKNGVEILQQRYENKLLKDKHIVIATTDDPVVNQKIYNDCKAISILVNLADNPDFCDFYMGGIVTKGNVKIAISTNGKSPTMAKRLRQFFENILPDSLDLLADNLHKLRRTISGDFDQKVTQMNIFTEGLIHQQEIHKQQNVS